ITVCFLRDCLFQQTPRDAFYSTSGNWLLELGGGDLRAAHRGPAVKRQRRSEEVNPADPLQTVSHPSPPTKDGTAGQPEQDQTGAVSKETLSSCDDPLRVLQPNGPGSPVKTNIADRPEHQ
uniref:Uncharacterized protein n=1 Tax=Kryptolebias marmoratus TaxID=37003 RepID=A0A3Q3BG66_KRYMA